MIAPTRRLFVLTPFLLAACGGETAPSPPVRRSGAYAALHYAYLPPLPLNIARLTVADDFTPPKGETEVGQSSPVSIVDTLTAMARDRLKPAGKEGLGTFHIQTASMTRRSDTLNGTVAIRLDVHNGEDSGFIEARATAPRTGADQDLRGTAYELLKALMDDLNIEVEYQIRRELRAWLVDAKLPEPKRPSTPEPKRPPASGKPLPLPPPPPPRV